VEAPVFVVAFEGEASVVLVASSAVVFAAEIFAFGEGAFGAVFEVGVLAVVYEGIVFAAVVVIERALVVGHEQTVQAGIGRKRTS